MSSITDDLDRELSQLKVESQAECQQQGVSSIVRTALYFCRL